MLTLLRVIGAIVLIYLILIMPRMVARPDSSPFTGRLYAHRGLHDNTGDAPENSMEAFRRAVEAGYGIELDVQLTADGVPVVFHDFTLCRVARYDADSIPEGMKPDSDGEYSVSGNVRDYTYEELLHFHLCGSGERIPRFEDVLKLIAGRVPLIVEFKVENNVSPAPAVCVTTWPLLETYEGVYCIESFHPMALWWYRRNHPGVFRGQLAEEFFREDPNAFKSPIYFVLAMLLLDIFTAPDFIAYNHRHAGNLSRMLVHGLYRSTAAAWTIKSQQELVRAGGRFEMFIFDSFIPEEITGSNHQSTKRRYR